MKDIFWGFNSRSVSAEGLQWDQEREDWKGAERFGFSRIGRLREDWSGAVERDQEDSCIGLNFLQETQPDGLLVVGDEDRFGEIRPRQEVGFGVGDEGAVFEPIHGGQIE